MKPNSPISILCTGSEILDGRILETNSRLVIDRLKEVGLSVRRTISCRDSIDDIQSSISYLLDSCDALIISGGLGPTSDDITRDAVAAVAGVSLVKDEQALERLRLLYERRKRKFEESNQRQAYFPKGASIIPNPIGTAAGFSLTLNAKHIYCLPGIPGELEPMLRDSIIPALANICAECRAISTPQVIRVFGLSEAKIGELVEKDSIPPGISVSYRASFPEIFVRISGSQTALTENFADSVRQTLGQEYVVSNSEQQHFVEVVQALLQREKKTVAVAESCTGGLVSSYLTQSAGASECFLGGVVSYSNEAKVELLSVPAQVIAKHGAVSHETACAMAKGALDKFHSNLAISITGIAGPSGGSEEKPVGTFFIGVCDQDGLIKSFKCFIGLSRDMNRQFAAFTALDTIRRYLLKLPLLHERALAR